MSSSAASAPAPPNAPVDVAAVRAQRRAVVVKRAEGAVVPSFDFRVDFCATTARGACRASNQDALCCSPEIALFAVADGLGGHPAGEVAAALAIEAAEAHLRQEVSRALIRAYAAQPDVERRRLLFGLLERAMERANEAVRLEGERNQACLGMGTTLDLVLLARDRAFIAHVGDARVYLVRPTATLQLTHDHAAYDSLRVAGKRASRAARSPLSNSIGHRERLTIDTLFVDLSQGDRLLLCSDGVFDPLVSEAELQRHCRGGTVEALCHRLTRASRELGGLDDATVVVVDVCDRFVKRQPDPGPQAQDIDVIARSALLAELSAADVLSTLAAGVEVEIEAGKPVQHAVANDRVAYIVLEGVVALPGGKRLGPSGMLFIESLLDIAVRTEFPQVEEHARLLRIRYDDFNEVCDHDPHLAAELYKRIAKHLALSGAPVR